jgi:hypothetical protein
VGTTIAEVGLPDTGGREKMKTQKNPKLMKALKFFLGLSFWILGFLLMNIDNSYSSNCSPEKALKNAIHSARELTGKEELHSYRNDDGKIFLRFADGSRTLLEVSPKNCEIVEVEVLP